MTDKVDRRHRKTIPPSELPDIPNSFDSPDSSTVIGATYDKETRKMRVNFRHGTDYFFDDIEPDLWRDYVMAHSKGSFFSSRIRPFFAGRKVVISK